MSAPVETGPTPAEPQERAPLEEVWREAQDVTDLKVTTPCTASAPEERRKSWAKSWRPEAVPVISRAMPASAPTVVRLPFGLMITAPETARADPGLVMPPTPTLEVKALATRAG